MRALLIVALATLSGCASAQTPTSIPDQPAPQRVTVVFVENANTFCQKKLGRVYARGRMYGCSEWDGSVCSIYVDRIVPNTRQEHAVIYSSGHELLHCILGHFHSETGETK